MPVGLVLVVAGLILVFATSYVTLGWILFGIGVGISLVALLVFGVITRMFTKQFKGLL